jgi:long-chain acyl-CoA synthetase
MELITIKELLDRNAEKYRNQVAFQIRTDTGFRTVTFEQVLVQVKKIQAALQSHGVEYQDRVALISENRPEWVISYLAITSMGAIAVPLDAMLSKEEVVPLINDCNAKVIILSEKYTDYTKGTLVEGREIFMEEFDKLASSVPSVKTSVKLDDTASIVYTSGTTGIAKGVVLTHKNIMSNVVVVAPMFDLGPGDNFLSVLPLHHTFETTAGFLGPFYMGCKITYAESLKSHNLLRNMKDTKVTVMCGVPLLYQLFYDGIMREVEEKKMKPLFSALFFISKFFKHVIGFNIGKKIFSIVHKKFGGKIRFFVSGGAALDPNLIRNFDLMGFTILQGYGLTESSPILTCNNLKENRVGSVGKAIPGVELKITGDEPVGEIYAFGPNIMKGYYKRGELTSRIVVNGWLHTGDVGYLDEEGYLFITGRFKDVIVTASGVNVYPDELEYGLNNIPEIKESCIMGTKVKAGIRKGSEEVFAAIVPDLEYFSKKGIVDQEKIVGIVEEVIRSYNSRIVDYKRIARYDIRKDELPKTRLLKIKRFELRKELGI